MLALALRCSLPLLGALLAARALRHAASRRDLLTAGLLLALLLPALQRLPLARVELPLPAWSAVSAPAPAAAPPVTGPARGQALQEPAAAPRAPARSALPWWAWVWAAGSALFALRSAAGLRRAWRWRSSATAASAAWSRAAAELPAPLSLRAHPGLDSPLVVGWLRPTVLVPARCDWPHARRLRALRHEQAHIAAHDTLRLLLAETVCALLWWNPLAWGTRRALHLAQEQAADAAVRRSAPADRYAADLIDLARTLRAAPLYTSALGASPLEHRIRSLLAPAAPARPLRRAALALGLLALTGLAALGRSAPLQAEPAPAPLAPRAASPLQPRAQALVDAEVTALVEAWSPSAVSIAVLDAASGATVALGQHGAVQPWAPGSVLKPFVAVAALERAIGPDSARLEHLLAVSDNPGFVDLAQRLGAVSLSETFGQHGLAADPGLAPRDLALGQFPLATADLARAYLRLDDSARGQQVRGLLRAVVHSDEGTGRAAAPEQGRVAGKTGTSRLDEERLLASFIGLVPADAPRWAIAVQVVTDDPQGYGGRVAAPVFAHLADALP